MKFIFGFITSILILPIVNCVALLGRDQIPWGIKVILLIIGFVSYGLMTFIPGTLSGRVRKGCPFRLRVLLGGYEQSLVAALALVWSAGISFIIPDWRVRVFGVVIALLLIAVLGWQGVIRMIICSTQVKFLFKIIVLLFWWLPPINIYLQWRLRKNVELEFQIDSHFYEMQTSQAENEICRTRYPILMVHGVFFRDWHYFNYWGRIPKALISNGASVIYGNQQSALSIAESGEELAKQIQEIILMTGCEKLNIVAHSKGGLDARFAISKLNMAPYVASLTTINTPHDGCQWADEILRKIPESLVKVVAKRYNSIFKRLGDANPNFIEAVNDLTHTNAVKFNQEVYNSELVYYQSVMSKMSRPSSNGFPLNLTYRIIRKSQGDNDGLVPIESARWGNYLGMLNPPDKKGISHADMIDLRRENIQGFDVRLFYVDLIKGLKEKGF